MKILHLFSAFIFFCFIAPLSAENLKDVNLYPVNPKAELSAGGYGTLTIKIEIPDNHYIYGNPKGPGVGRPTTVSVNHPENFSFDPAKFEPAKKYTPKGEKDYVWIYEKETKIELPFKVKENTKQGEYKVSVSAQVLLCSDKTCIPYDFKFNYPVRVLTEKGSTPVNAADGRQGPRIEIPDSDSGVNNNILSQELSGFKPRYVSTVSVSNIIEAVIFGLIAGFILNFMPCVLPVISLKILDFVKHSGDDKKEIRKMGMTFASGIITSFAVLAFLASFLGYNWGALFQSTLFLLIMLTIVFVLSLSMFGVFTLNIPGFADKASRGVSGKYANAYSKGILATLLATPCSGPFLGGTLAWAAVQPYYVIFAVFMSIGAGMSLPYIILTAKPGLAKFIPKPGDWMHAFENIVGFLLLGTCVYLMSILAQDLLIPTISFLLFTGIAAWQYGRYGSIIKSRKSRIISRAAAVIIIIAGYFLSYNFLASNKENIEFMESGKMTFSSARIMENRDKGKISIVQFTADWCPNCKFVEKTSLYTEKVAKAVKQNNIEFLIADITRENPEATDLLNKLGSRSIPFLAVFPAGEAFKEPVCLRDIYSEEDVLKAIEMAK